MGEGEGGGGGEGGGLTTVIGLWTIKRSVLHNF